MYILQIEEAQILMLQLQSQSLYFFMYNIDRMPEFEFEAASTTARCATNELGAFESIGSGSRLQL